MCPRLICCLVCSWLLWVPPALAQVHIIDDLGRKVVLNEPATRIIALYGAFNEIIASIGQEDRLIARTNADELPASILQKPSIGTHLRPNPELIIGLKPDLVIQIAGREEALEPVRFLDNHGVTTAVFRMDTFADLFSATERLGELTGSATQARTLVDNMQKELDTVQTAWPEHKPRIFFEARYPNLLAAGGSSFTTEIITRAGGLNAVSASDKLVRLNEEEVLRLGPDIYLVQQGPMNPVPQPLAEREHFKTLACLRTGQVHTVDQQLFSRPGPRSIQAVRDLHAMILAAATGGKQ